MRRLPGPPNKRYNPPAREQRLRLIKSIADERTAMKMRAVIREGNHPNIEQALRTAIGRMAREIKADGYRWRYYCTACEFIGAPDKSFTLAEYHSTIHENAVETCEDGCVVFAYWIDEWDSDDVEWLVEKYQSQLADQ